MDNLKFRANAIKILRSMKKCNLSLLMRIKKTLPQNVISKVRDILVGLIYFSTYFEADNNKTRKRAAAAPIPIREFSMFLLLAALLYPSAYPVA